MNEVDEKSNVDQESSNEKPIIKDDKRWHRRHNHEPWLGGVILILVGIIFLTRNLTGFYFENWWALFILIPAFNSFIRARQMFENADGQLTSSARGALISGLVLTTVTAILLFDLSWMIFGPILLVVAGVAVLLNALLPK